MADDAQIRTAELDDDWVWSQEITEPHPRGSDSNVGDAAPRLPPDAVGIRIEVDLRETIELGSRRFVSYALDLRGFLFLPPYDERDTWITPEVLDLARAIERVEHDFEPPAHRETNDGRLWPAGLGDARLYGQAVAPEKCK